jgi:energy-coupling factor transport system ATP-binding protein
LALLEVKDLTFELAGRTILDGITLSIQRGERVAILGANGSGKTTLAQCLAGWLPSLHQAASRGKLTFGGSEWKDWPLPQRAASVQLVGQLPVQQLSGREFTVRDEIAFGPGNLALPVSEVSARTEEALELCGLTHLADRDPFTLSGGEQQRAVIAAALAMRPQLLILDEPVTNLDPSASEHVVQVVSELPEEITVVWMDTSPKIAVEFARRFILLRNGRCVVDGSPRQVLLHPDSLATIGLPPPAEAARLAAKAGLWPDGLPYPLTLQEARATFKQVKHGQG